jgi:diguanylate cyclase (GGDEF)-like protein
MFLVGMVVSLGFAAFLTMFLDKNMITELKERETGQLKASHAQLASLLRRGALGISTSLEEWAEKDETYNSMMKPTSGRGRQFLRTAPMPELHLNYAALVTRDGGVHQRFFDRSAPEGFPSAKERETLERMALKLHSQTLKKYGAFLKNEITSPAMMTGYADIAGKPYFLAAAPVARVGSETRPNGTMIFGRRVDNREILLIYPSEEQPGPETTDVSIAVWRPEETANLMPDRVLRNKDRDKLTIQSLLETIDGSAVVLSTTRSRESYGTGLAAVRTFSAIIFAFAYSLSCCVLLSAEACLTRPVELLTRRVSQIECDSPDMEFPSFRTKEINVLSEAVRNVIRQLEERKNHTEKQNARLSEMNRELRQLANYDLLTKLPNKNMFRTAVEKEINEAEAGDMKALIYFGVLNLRSINESRGRSAGDKTLIEISKLLCDAFSDSVMVSSFGTGVFALLVSAKDREEVTAAACRLTSIFDRPFLIENHEITTSVNAGISVYPDDGDSFDLLDSCADTAMRNAKDPNGTSSFLFFDRSQMDEIMPS